MIYFLYGDQYPSLKKQLKLLKETLIGKQEDEFNCVNMSCKDSYVQEIVEEASKPPLFAPKKVIIVTNPYFLTTTKEKLNIEADKQKFDILKAYIKDPLPYSDIIFFYEGLSISKKSEIYKLIAKYGTIKEVASLSEEQLKNTGIQYFNKKNVKIDFDALNELMFRCGNDLAKFTMEANKLCIYSSHITKADVEALVSLKLEQNAFAIAENLMQGNIDKALKIYTDLRTLKEEPVRLIALMASQFRILTEVGYLKELNKTQEEISKIMGIHPYRVQLALKNLNLISKKKAQSILDDLYDLDYRIKSGQVDPYFGFELFILNFKERNKNK